MHDAMRLAYRLTRYDVGGMTFRVGKRSAGIDRLLASNGHTIPADAPWVIFPGANEGRMAAFDGAERIDGFIRKCRSTWGIQ